jgi:hypothetical protein
MGSEVVRTKLVTRESPVCDECPVNVVEVPSGAVEESEQRLACVVSWVVVGESSVIASSPVSNCASPVASMKGVSWSVWVGDRGAFSEDGGVGIVNVAVSSDRMMFGHESD